MEQKNYTEVLIDGKIYTLGGEEDEMYLQKVAAYLNDKIGKLKKQEGFLRQNADYQMVMLALNLADDYFKAQELADTLTRQKDEAEKENYSLKHELISTQMKLEALQRDMEKAAGKPETVEVNIQENTVSEEVTVQQAKPVSGRGGNRNNSGRR